MVGQARCRWVQAHIMCYEGELRAWLRGYGPALSRSDIDDLIQEAYVRVWQSNLDLVSNPRGYLYAVVRNLRLDRARRERIVSMEPLSEHTSLSLPSEAPSPERHASAAQELERVMTAIDCLPARCARAFRLQRLAGRSQREIAQEMRISEKAVEKHLANACRKLIQAVVEDCDRPGVYA